MTPRRLQMPSCKSFSRYAPNTSLAVGYSNNWTSVLAQPRERFSNLQIVILRTLLKQGGYQTPLTLPAWQRADATKLWRRGLVEVWFRKCRDGTAGFGPFFSLTIVGARIALDFTNPAPRGISGAEKAI